MILSDFRERGLDRLELACRRCERAGFCDLEHALETWGDAKLTGLLAEMTTDCPHGKQGTSFDRCGTCYPALVQGL